MSLAFCLQKIGYDNAAAVAKKAHKEGCTLKVWILFIVLNLLGIGGGRAKLFNYYIDHPILTNVGQGHLSYLGSQQYSIPGKPMFNGYSGGTSLGHTMKNPISVSFRNVDNHIYY